MPKIRLKGLSKYRPPKKVLDEYFGMDTKSFKYGYSKDDKSEIEAAELLIGYLKPKSFYRMPEVKMPEGIRAPDFLIDGAEYEVKAPRNYRRMSKRIFEAKGQFRRKGLLVISSYYCSVDEKRFLNEVKRVARQTRLKELFVVINHSIKKITIKK